jgi:maltose alpha-D-glucosyltransferase/alpha-amylase
MGENLELFGRTAVRAPMQWSSGENGGFSSAPPDKLRRALPEGEDGPDRLNVAAQRRDPGSLLSWMERAIWRRRECPEIGMGVFSLLDVALDEVLACRYDWCESTVIVVHNLGGDELEVPLPFDAAAERAELVEVFSDRGYPSPGPGAADIALGSFGYRWFRVRRGGQPLPV